MDVPEHVGSADLLDAQGLQSWLAAPHQKLALLPVCQKPLTCTLTDISI